LATDEKNNALHNDAYLHTPAVQKKEKEKAILDLKSFFLNLTSFGKIILIYVSIFKFLPSV